MAIDSKDRPAISLEELRQLNALTDRVKKRKQEYLKAVVRPVLASEACSLLTESWKETDGENLATRRTKALKKILDGVPIVIREAELIVGSVTKNTYGCYPPVHWQPQEISRLLEAGTFKTDAGRGGTISDEDQKIILECCNYWKTKSIEYKSRQLIRTLWGNSVDDCEEVRLFDLYLQTPVGMKMLDFDKVLNNGFTFIIAEARDRQKKLVCSTKEDLQRWYFLEAVILALEAGIGYAKRHAALARDMAAEETAPLRKQELEEIAEICEQVPANPARNFREALQSFWFTTLIGRLELLNLGESPHRFDQYMFPFYKKSVLDQKGMTRQGAIELLALVWTKIAELVAYKGGLARIHSQGSDFINLNIGGVTPDGKDATNELTFLILEMERQVRYPQPHISLKWHEDMSEEFLIQAIDCNLATVGGIPAFFNDKVGNRTMLEEYGVPISEARNWAVGGCVSRKIPAGGHSIPSPFISLGKILELAMNNGIDPGTKKRLGPPTGDPRGFADYEDFENATRQQIDATFKLAADMHNVHVNVIREHFKMPYTSALMNDCIERGLDLCDGGMRYGDLICHLDPVGHTDAADSLTAIRKLIYDDRQITWDELLEALSVNFEGMEDLRQKLLAAPKFGNDDDYADQAMIDIHVWTEAAAKAQRNPWGKPYGINRQGGGVHLLYGPTTGALPSGRKAWEPFADGSISPMKGMDTKGLTAVFNSVVKVPTLGSDSVCLNQKLVPTILGDREGKRKLLSAIKTYFDRWGYHVQFNIVDHNELLDAREHPEQYRDLVVRVAGYSAFWVDLTPEVQDEIIARSLQTLS